MVSILEIEILNEGFFDSEINHKHSKKIWADVIRAL